MQDKSMKLTYFKTGIIRIEHSKSLFKPESFKN